MMKKFLILSCMLFSTITFAQTTPTASPSDCTNAFFKAMLEEDAAPIEKLTADDFSIISFDGSTANRDLLLQGVSGGFVVVETATTSIIQARAYNDNAAVVTGTWKAKGAIQGNNFDSEVVFSTTYVKVAGSWKMVSMQFTSVPK